MGAYDVSHTINAKGESAAVKAAEAYQRRCQYESGHAAYTGHLGTAGIGVQTHPHIFPDEVEARRWALDHHSKWDVPYLLRYGEPAADTWLLVGWCSS